MILLGFGNLAPRSNRHFDLDPFRYYPIVSLPFSYKF